MRNLHLLKKTHINDPVTVIPVCWCAGVLGAHRLRRRSEISKQKGKAVPLQTRRGPDGSRKSRFPDFITTALDGGKVVSLTHRPPLPPTSAPGTHFC